MRADCAPCSATSARCSISSCMTITGKSLGENIAGAKVHNPDVIRTLETPIAAAGGLAILRGNLAPEGAVMKPIAAEAHLLKHEGRAVVFDSYDEMIARIDDPKLEVDASSVLVLRNAGPKGGPGMPEWGSFPSRRSSSKKEFATCSASPMRG